MATLSSLLKPTFVVLSLLSILLFFFLLQTLTLTSNPSPPPPLTPHRSLSLLNPNASSSKPTISCPSSIEPSSTFIDYTCFRHQNPIFSLSSLSLLLIFYFYFLIKTAQDHFSLITTKLSSHLNLTPSMAAITLLALGNGAPDVFSSVAAVASGQYRTGFGAILSAGTFVSGFVVGFVAIYAAPFGVDSGFFIRDVLFYMIGALFLFWVYLSGEIFLWQAVGFVGFYVFFVGFVFWMDLGGDDGDRKKVGMVENNGDVRNGFTVVPDCETGEVGGGLGREEGDSGLCGALCKISLLWEVPVSVLLKFTIPQSSPSEWNRFYISANIVLCPLALLYACNSFMPMDHPIVFLLPNTHFPLWLIVLIMSSSLGILHFVMEKEPPKTEQLPVILAGFVMSVFWISTIAGELLNCLVALGALLKLPPSLLGITVLAWGNSVGDLVADVALAKAGHPAMAMAGCFACPMFNMLVGLGTALVIQTAKVYPKAYVLHFHVGIVIAFVFLFLSLMGSLLVITWHRFRVPRFWGFCLVGLYAVFTVVSLLIVKFSS